jgi:hypothetical protein
MVAVASKRGQERVKQAFLLATLVVATYLLWGTWATWPVELLVVFVRECGHALAVVLTGGEVLGMSISHGGGGSTTARGGVPLITLQAGYAASAAFGASMVLAAARPRTARGSLGGMAAITAACALAFARPVMGMAMPFALTLAVLLAWVAHEGGDRTVQGLLVYLATVSALYVLDDIRRELVIHGRVTDAALLAERTGVPALIWSGGWAVITVAALALALRRALR